VIVDVLRHPTAADLAEAVAGRLVTTLVERVGDTGIAHLCLTGGGIGTAVLQALHGIPAVDAVDWPRVHVWWGDERFLPQGDPDRNETGARAALLDHIAIPADNIHAMPTPASSGESVDVGADLYAGELAAHASPGLLVPAMDILLLGIGPDAHVASLFPELPAVHDERPVAGVHGAPKPPPLRITLTFPTIHSARQVWILASGREKAAAVRLALMPGAGAWQVPAAGARGSERTLFLLDQEAAEELPVDLGRPSA
jgi:6-phosphogluconolactonase